VDTLPEGAAMPEVINQLAHSYGPWGLTVVVVYAIARQLIARGYRFKIDIGPVTKA
jgi:hypothetical protein